MHLRTYLGLLHDAEQSLADAFRQVGSAHRDEPDIEHLCQVLAGQADGHVASIAPIIHQYGQQRDDEPERLRAAEFSGTRKGGVRLLRDLHDLYALASFVDITWTVVLQAAQALRDKHLITVVNSCDQDTTRQLTWLQTRINQAAPQALIASP
ncbi:MAG TPA: hypothetical protein VGD71_43990 [Kribbella sp.]